MDRTEPLWQQAHNTAHQSLRSAECRRQAEQILDQISTHMMKIESYGLRIGSNIIHATTLKEAYVTSIYRPAMTFIEGADDVIENLQKLDGIEMNYLISCLRKLKENLLEDVETPFQILSAVCDYNFLFDKAARWYHLVLGKISFRHALQSERSAELGIFNSALCINPVWKEQACSFLIQHSPPDPGELFRLCQLSDRLSEYQPDIQRQRTTRLPQRCSLLLNLLTCSGKVLLSDLQQAIYWQKHLAVFNAEYAASRNIQSYDNTPAVHKICNNTEKFINDDIGHSNVYPVTRNAKHLAQAARTGDTRTIFHEDQMAVQKSGYNSLLSPSENFQKLATRTASINSTTPCKLAVDGSLTHTPSQSTVDGAAKTHRKSEHVTCRNHAMNCMCSKNILNSFLTRPAGEDLNSYVPREECALLPKNPWLSLPIESPEMPYDITPQPNDCAHKGFCNLCCVKCKDQPIPVPGFTNLTSPNVPKTKSVETQASVCGFSLWERAAQTDESFCGKLSDILHDSGVLAPDKLIASSSMNKDVEEFEDIINLTPRDIYNGVDLHLSRSLLDVYHDKKLSTGAEWLFTDWDLKEGDELSEIEKMLQKAEHILMEEESVFQQEREFDLLLQNEAVNAERNRFATNTQKTVNNITPVMCPNETTDTEVAGHDDMGYGGAQSKMRGTSNNPFAENEHELARTGCRLVKENHIALKPQHCPKLREELKELYVIETKIWDENLKIEQLRELEIRGKVKDQNSLLTQTRERLSFLVKLQRERNEVEQLENSLAKEEAIKKQKLKKMLERQSNKSRHHPATSKHIDTSAVRLITSLGACLDISSIRSYASAINQKQQKHCEVRAPSTEDLIDPAITRIPRLKNKRIDQEDDHNNIPARTACKGPDSRIVEGRESNAKEASNSASCAVKPKISLQSSIEIASKSLGRFLATGKPIGPIAKPTKAVLSKPPNPSFQHKALSNSSDLQCKDCAMQKSLYPDRAKRNVKVKDVQIGVRSNILLEDRAKHESCQDFQDELQHCGSQTCSPCNCRRENKDCSSAEKCTVQNVQVPHNSRKMVGLKPLSESTPEAFPQEPLKVTSQRSVKPKIHFPLNNTKQSTDLSCLRSKKQNGDAYIRSCSDVTSRKPGLKRCPLQVPYKKLSDCRSPIVIDAGSGLMKAGFVDHDLPVTVFPTVIGILKNKGTALTHHDDEIYIGHEAQHTQSTLTLKYPIQHGIVTDWNELEKIWHYTFYDQLRVNPEEHPVMVTETAMNRQSKSHLAQILFEVFNVPFAFVAIQAVLALYSSGRTTGVVFSSGEEVSYTIPVYEGHALPHAIQQVNLAGQDLTNYLRKLLERKGVLPASAKQELILEIKEKCCYMAEDAEAEHFSSMPYTLPDGQTIILEDERFRASEVFFKPELIGKHTYGVHESLFRSLLLSDVDLRKTFAENILLSGGSTRLPGFSSRFQKEVCSMVPLDLLDSVAVTTLPDQDLAAWSGGAALASLPAFDSAWMSKEEYYEFGADIVYRRCF